MNGLTELRRLACNQIRAKYPTLPEAAIVSPKYQDRTANGLTSAIVAFITLSGGWATRVTSTGQMRTVGHTEVQGSGRMMWIPGTTKRGTADIHAVYRGHHLSIEVKIGKDRQSTAQRQVEQQINAAGGTYFIARSFDEFYQWICGLKTIGCR